MQTLSSACTRQASRTAQHAICSGLCSSSNNALRQPCNSPGEPDNALSHTGWTRSALRFDILLPALSAHGVDQMPLKQSSDLDPQLLPAWSSSAQVAGKAWNHKLDQIPLVGPSSRSSVEAWLLAPDGERNCPGTTSRIAWRSAGLGHLQTAGTSGTKGLANPSLALGTCRHPWQRDPRHCLCCAGLATAIMVLAVCPHPNDTRSQA